MYIYICICAGSFDWSSTLTSWGLSFWFPFKRQKEKKKTPQSFATTSVRSPLPRLKTVKKWRMKTCWKRGWFNWPKSGCDPLKYIKIGMEPRNFYPWWSLDDLGGTRFWESFLVHPKSIPCFQASLWAEHGCGMLLVSLWYTLTDIKQIYCPNAQQPALLLWNHDYETHDCWSICACYGYDWHI